MTLLCDLRRLGARALAPVVSVVLSATLLAACGGGTSQVDPFKPARVLALGDENSVIVDDGNHDGLRYTINDRRGSTAGKCNASPIFVQSLAAYYGFAFEQCNPNGLVPKAFVHAVVGATIDDPVKGLAAQIAGITDLASSDLVSLMIGGNDVIELFEQVRDGTRSSTDAIAEAQQRGLRAAAMVSGLLTTGAHVLVVTAPDLGLSPYAVAQELTYPGAAALLSKLSYELNGYLRTSVEPNDGRFWGLVLADDIVAAMAKLPSSFLTSPAIANVAACTTASAIDCMLTDDTTTSTLVEGAGTGTHLWADDRHLGPAAHSRIGLQLQSRAVNNPF
jgi:hypothetical protein